MDERERWEWEWERAYTARLQVLVRALVVFQRERGPALMRANRPWRRRSTPWRTLRTQSTRRVLRVSPLG